MISIFLFSQPDINTFIDKISTHRIGHLSIKDFTFNCQYILLSEVLVYVQVSAHIY